MNERTVGQIQRIRASEIMDRLAEVEKLSACVLEQSQAIHDFFLGESPKSPSQLPPPRRDTGYFCQVKNGLDDVHANLEEALNRLLVFGKEIGIDATKISERPEQRV